MAFFALQEELERLHYESVCARAQSATLTRQQGVTQLQEIA